MKLTIALCVGATIVFIWATEGLPDENRFKNEAELSYVQTGGNTKVATLSFKNLLKYKFSERLSSAWKLGALYGESDDKQTAESYMTELRADYKLQKKLYIYGQAGYMTDEFAGFDKRYYGGLGAGYKFLDGLKHLLSIELGLNYSVEEYIDRTDDRSVEGRAFGLYEYAIAEKSRIHQSIEYLYDFNDGENYRVNSDSALKVQINTILTLKIGYEVRYDNAPIPETLDKTDTRFYTAIVATI